MYMKSAHIGFAPIFRETSGTVRVPFPSVFPWHVSVRVW